MKILHIISSLVAGGAEVYVRDLASRMVIHGHEICVAYISSAIDTNRCAKYEESFKQNLTKAGVSFFEIGHDCRRTLWKGGLRLRKIIKNFNPDIVHSHLYYGLFFKAFSFDSTPLVYTHHNHRLGKGRYLYPFFNMFVDRYIGISRDCTDVLKNVGVMDVSTIYNGVSIDRLLVKEKYNFKKTHIAALAIGSLNQQKNFILLINACHDLLRRRTDLRECFKLEIAGEGPQKNELQKLIENLGLNTQVSLLGNRQDIPQLLHDCDVFVMSSDWEGLPISLLEALMTGVPAVVTDVGGCRDVVESCGAGLIVGPGDVVALSEAIEFIIDNPHQTKKMAENAKGKSKQYSIDASVESHLALYENLGGR